MKSAASSRRKSVKFFSPSDLWTSPRVCGHSSPWESVIWTLHRRHLRENSDTHDDRHHAEQHQRAARVHLRLWPRHGWSDPTAPRGSSELHLNRAELKYSNFTVSLDHWGPVTPSEGAWPLRLAPPTAWSARGGERERGRGGREGGEWAITAESWWRRFHIKTLCRPPTVILIQYCTSDGSDTSMFCLFYTAEENIRTFYSTTFM